MNELERFFRHLAGHLSTSAPDSLRGGHTLGALLVDDFPYRVARRRLAIECSEDYEMLMMRLAAGEGSYLELADPKAVETLRQELSGVNPDLTLLAVFGDIEVRFSSLAVARAMGQPDDAEYRPADDAEAEGAGSEAEQRPAGATAPQLSPTEPETPAPASGPEVSPPASEVGGGSGDESDLEVPAGGPPSPPPLPFAAGPIEPARHSVGGPSCGSCGTELPAGRPARFCPHCGRNLLALHCSNCRAELEPGWRHCVECGAPVAGAGPPPAR